MLQTNLKVVAVGEPNIEALTDGEKRTFFESIFSRIVELHQQTQTENKNEIWLKSRKITQKKLNKLNRVNRKILNLKITLKSDNINDMKGTERKSIYDLN